MNKEMELNLIKCAFDAREKAYVPYSNFAVGAALLAKNGTVYQGCNIENASFTPTNCAERTAFFKAVYDGVRDFEAIAIVGGKKDVPREQCEICAPCGVCRQVMREFCNPETFQIILASNETEYQIYTLSELMPLSFGPENLQ
ncbi:MAG: cytidine deaminase [Marvinbryantia sp.]|jgi:cytidine deaminase